MDVGEGAQAPGGVGVGRARIAEMGDGIAGQAVSATLEQDELRACGVDERLHPLPGAQKRVVVRIRRHWNVELGAGGVAAAGGQAFFAGGFYNFEAGLGDGGRSNRVDVYDSATKAWSTMELSTNRSNLSGVSVLGRYALFGGGTRIPAPAPDLCGTMERSAVVDIYDSATRAWSTTCLKVGRTLMNAIGVGRTAVFFGAPGDPIDLLRAP